ncbi:MAG: aspartate/glutamate racemase family protein [Candidatus Bathyarchaeia archaeon]
MKICAIIPILKNKIFEDITYRELKAAARPDVEITVESIERGPASIESMYDDEMSVEPVLEKVKEAEKKGFDAVIIDCMLDPGLEAAREIVDIPVIGPCQSSMAIASTLGDKFGMVALLDRAIPLFWRMAKRFGYENRVASIRAISVPVLEIETKKDKVKSDLLKESKKVLEDGADTIILACTGLIGIARELQEALKVPVVDPGVTPLKIAEILVDLKLSQSKVVYPKPPKKEIRV